MVRYYEPSRDEGCIESLDYEVGIKLEGFLTKPNQSPKALLLQLGRGDMADDRELLCQSGATRRGEKI